MTLHCGESFVALDLVNIMAVDWTNYQLGTPDREKQEGRDVLDEDMDRILEDIERLYIKLPPQTPKPFILIPTGLTASGKTTIVRALAEHFSLVVIRTDDVRSYLEQHGYNLRRTIELGSRLVMSGLRRGYGVAIDADVVRGEDRSAMRALAKDLSMPLVSIKIVTPESVILERLRAENLAREYRGDEAVERYFERKELHSDSDLDHDVIFRGDEDIEPQLHAAFQVIEDLL